MKRGVCEKASRGVPFFLFLINLPGFKNVYFKHIETNHSTNSASWAPSQGLSARDLPETHSTPGVGLARVRTFLIFGTAERTPFARKAKLDVSRGKTLIPNSDFWLAAKPGLAKSPSLSGFYPRIVALTGGSTGLFSGNRLSFTN